MAAATTVQQEPAEKPPNSPLLGHATIQKLASDEKSGVPLNTRWTFWVDKSTYGTSAAQYEATQRKIYTISTVEGFWSVYNNIPQPSEVGSRHSYHLMREDRKPLWEDPAHSSGGNWKLKCHKPDSNEAWREMLLAAIGEQLTDCVAPGDEIGGVSISIRERDDVLQIWNKQSSLAGQATVIEKVHGLLPSVEFTASFYKAFESHEAFEKRF